jgi:photosystem II stability/assembly factor-like uncharacterized protein
VAGRAFIKCEDGVLVNLDRTDRIYVSGGEVFALQDGGRSISICSGGKDELKAVTSAIEAFIAGDGGLLDAAGVKHKAYVDSLHPAVRDGAL